MCTKLGHIADGYIDQSVFDTHCASVTTGPLAIDACVDVSAPSAAVTVKLAGVEIGRCALSLIDQECKIGGSVAGFKAEVKLVLKADCLAYEAVVAAPLFVYETEGNVYCWG